MNDQQIQGYVLRRHRGTDCSPRFPPRMVTTNAGALGSLRVPQRSLHFVTVFAKYVVPLLAGLSTGLRLRAGSYPPKAYDQSTSEPLPQPALSASPRRWRPRVLTEYEREQSRWDLQQIRSEPILRRLMCGLPELTELLIAHMGDRFRKWSIPMMLRAESNQDLTASNRRPRQL